MNSCIENGSLESVKYIVETCGDIWDGETIDYLSDLTEYGGSGSTEIQDYLKMKGCHENAEWYLNSRR